MFISIYSCRKYDVLESIDFEKTKAAIEAVSISNDLFVNNLTCSFKLKKGFVRPFDDIESSVPAQIVPLQQNLNVGKVTGGKTL